MSDVPGCVSWRSSQPRAGAGVPGVSGPLAVGTGLLATTSWLSSRTNPLRMWERGQRHDRGAAPAPTRMFGTARPSRSGPANGEGHHRVIDRADGLGRHRPAWRAARHEARRDDRARARPDEPAAASHVGARRVLVSGQDAGHPRLAEQPAPAEHEDVRWPAVEGAIKAAPGGCFRSASMGRAAGSSRGRSRSPP